MRPPYLFVDQSEVIRKSFNSRVRGKNLMPSPEETSSGQRDCLRFDKLTVPRKSRDSQVIENFPSPTGGICPSLSCARCEVLWCSNAVTPLTERQT